MRPPKWVAINPRRYNNYYDAYNRMHSKFIDNHLKMSSCNLTGGNLLNSHCSDRYVTHIMWQDVSKRDICSNELRECRNLEWFARILFPTSSLLNLPAGSILNFQNFKEIEKKQFHLEKQTDKQRRWTHGICSKKWQFNFRRSRPGWRVDEVDAIQ